MRPRRSGDGDARRPPSCFRGPRSCAVSRADRRRPRRARARRSTESPRSCRSRADGDGPARLHIDRVFTIRGAGTVVTGTLWSGRIARGDELVLLPAGRTRAACAGGPGPRRGRRRRGRRPARGGQPDGVSVGEVARGEVLAAADAGLTADLPDRRRDSSSASASPSHGDRVQVHHGTRESAGTARLARRPLLAGAARAAAASQRGDRLVIRQIAPPDTLGGGAVLDAHPQQARARPRAAPPGAGSPAARTPDAEPPRLPPVSRPTAPRTGAAPVPRAPWRSSAACATAGLEPPPDSELDTEDLAAHSEPPGALCGSPRRCTTTRRCLAQARARIVDRASGTAARSRSPRLRDELGTSRKFAQALLEHLDSRAGDDPPRRRARPAPAARLAQSGPAGRRGRRRVRRLAAPCSRAR